MANFSTRSGRNVLCASGEALLRLWTTDRNEPLALSAPVTVTAPMAKTILVRELLLWRVFVGRQQPHGESATPPFSPAAFSFTKIACLTDQLVVACNAILNPKPPSLQRTTTRLQEHCQDLGLWPDVKVSSRTWLDSE